MRSLIFHLAAVSELVEIISVASCCMFVRMQKDLSSMT